MDIFQFECFVKLVQCGTGALAAEQLYVSQPTLSRAIASLESELGVQLFDRVGRKLQLNEHGRLFYTYVFDAMEALKHGTEMAKSIHSESTGSIGIGCLGYNGVLTDCISSYCKENTHTSFRFNKFENDKPLSDQFYGLDILMSFSMWGQDHLSEQFPVTRELFDDEYYFVMSDKYRSFPEEKTTLAPEDMRDITYILMPTAFRPNHTSYLIWNKLRALIGVPSPKVIEVMDFAHKLTLLANGTGGGFLTAVCLPFAKQYDSSLRTYRIQGFPLGRRMMLSRRRKTEMSPQSLDFWQYMLNFYNLPHDTEL